MDDQAFLGSAAIASGGHTRAELRGPRFRRVFHDVYLPAAAPESLHTRSLAAYRLVADRGGVLAGYSATSLLRAECAPVDAPAEVIVDWNLESRAGLRVHRDTLRPDEVRTVAGCRVTTPLRTAYDLGRWLGLPEAVVALDTLAARFGFRPEDVRALRRPGARNIRYLDQAVELADPASDSPMETRLRVLLVLGGLPAPAVQHPVPDASGNILGRLDLAYPSALLGLEYDGEFHYDPARAIRDRRRDARMAAWGWQVMRFSAADVLATPNRTVELVRQVLAARA
ncbi:MAG TPA: DUF559 domain-containing protein [Pseudonocardia sp.]|nr:DUF559 domain-containing protein [Pseudonocardia sp.]